MATINISDVSDGEIVEDFEEISSEEDYFEKVEKHLIEANKRKIELELQNTLTYGKFR